MALIEEADDILEKSYRRLGDLGIKRARNHEAGYGQSQTQQNLYWQAAVIRLNLRIVLAHVILDENGDIAEVRRCTDEMMNRFLQQLQILAQTDDYPVIP
jgi:hypothetical protein